MKQIFILFISGLLLLSCEEKNMKNLPFKSESGFFNALIEIPAGTNKKYEYNTEDLSFEVDQRDGKDRIIPYLPYFANYGYIPSTLSDSTKGGDGDPVDIFVISEALSQGTLIPIIPIATVKLIDDNEEDYKIIAVPADETLNVLHVKTFEELKSKHPSIITIIETWLANYDTDPLKINGWLDQKETEDYIIKNSQN
ncbi:inorganic diphosphatase [Moheibacter sediminis]|nr:inorganic diphosphatase [Moheibacter sediminis]